MADFLPVGDPLCRSRRKGYPTRQRSKPKTTTTTMTRFAKWTDEATTASLFGGDSSVQRVSRSGIVVIFSSLETSSDQNALKVHYFMTNMYQGKMFSVFLPPKTGRIRLPKYLAEKIPGTFERLPFAFVAASIARRRQFD